MDTTIVPIKKTSEKGLHDHGIVATLCDERHFHLVFDHRLDADMQPELDDFNLTAGGQRIELESLSLKSGTRQDESWSLISFVLVRSIKPGTLFQLRYHPRHFFLWSEEREEPIEGFELRAIVADLKVLKALDLRVSTGPWGKETSGTWIKADARIIEACERHIRVELKHDLVASINPRIEDFRAESDTRYLNIDRIYVTRIATGIELSLLLHQDVEPNSRVKVTYKPGRRSLRTQNSEQLESFQVEAIAKAHHLDTQGNDDSSLFTFDDIDSLLELAQLGVDATPGENNQPEENNQPTENNQTVEDNQAIEVNKTMEDQLTVEASQSGLENSVEPVLESNNPESNVVPLFAEAKEEIAQAVSIDPPEIDSPKNEIQQDLDIIEFQETETRERRSLLTNLKRSNPYSLLVTGIACAVGVWALVALVNFFVLIFSFASFKNVLPEHVEHGQPQTIETVNIAPSEKNFSTTIDERKECELDYDDGAHFIGSCLNGIRDGGGVYTYANGDTYTGEWKHDMRNGSGMIRKMNGEMYAGAFYDDMMHGRGTYRWPDGRIYEGEFVNDEFHGYATLTETDGSRFEGNFEYNRMMEGTCYLPDGSQIPGICK